MFGEGHNWVWTNMIEASLFHFDGVFVCDIVGTDVEKTPENEKENNDNKMNSQGF